MALSERPETWAFELQAAQKAQMRHEGSPHGPRVCQERSVGMVDESSVPLRMVRRCCNALEIALLVEDAVMAIVSATRLRGALTAARFDLAPPFAADALDASWQRAAELLARAPTNVRTLSEIGRLMRLLDWATNDRRSILGPDLLDVDAARRELHRTDWSELHVASANLSESTLYGCSFNDSDITASDFSRANLVRASMRGARVYGCDFSGAILTDTILDAVVFEDCDLRGAHLGTERPSVEAAILCAHFVRCDLRETAWHRRFIGGVKLRDCNVYGMHGAATIDGVEIVGADASRDADGSEPRSGQEVIGSWRS